MWYKLIEQSNLHLHVFRNEKLFCEVRFSPLSSFSFGFSAVCWDGAEYQLRSNGFFFWRKLRLFKDGVLVGKFKTNRSLSPAVPVWLDSVGDLYLKDQKFSHVHKFSRAERKQGLLCQWECNDDRIEWATITLVLLSFQNKATPRVTPLSMISWR